MDNSALHKLSYGLYIAGARHGDRLAGSVVDAVMQAAMTPPVIALSSMKQNFSNEAVHETGEFTLSVLPTTVDPFVIANFGFQSSRNVDKWGNVPFELRDGLPVLSGCLSYMRCRVTQTVEYPSHTLFLAEAQDAWLGQAGEPLLYASYFSDLKTQVISAFKAYQENGSRPASSAAMPVTAPASQKKAVWRCGVCGYEYDGEIPFEQLSNDYVCPLCKQPKKVFSRVG